MEPQPGTPSLLRAINDRAALQVLSEHGPLSRTDLGLLTGLSKPTTAQLMDRLESAGLVEALPADGRSARRYRVRADAAYVAGLHVTGASIRARVADLTGRQVAQAELPGAGRDAHGAVDRVREALAGACAEAGLPPARLHRAVIGLGGSPDPRSGRLRYARHLPGWHDPELLSHLRTRLTGPGEPDPAVEIENDVNLAAVAEQARGATRPDGPHPCRDYAVLWIGEGIGAALVVGGRVHRGATGGAGEVGYMPVSGLPPVRTLGRGTTGGFQALAGAPAVLRLARDHGYPGPAPAAAVARAAADGDLGRLFLSEMADRLAVGLGPLVAVFDPELVVLTGSLLLAGGEALRELLAVSLYKLVIPRPRLVVSRLGPDSVLIGAIDAALGRTRQELFGDTRRIRAAEPVG